MNPLHLLWIIPLSSTMGVLTMCLAASNSTSRDIERRNDLRRALYDLYQSNTILGMSYKDYDTRRMAALAQAKEVLGL